MNKPFTYVEGMQLMAWYAIFKDELGDSEGFSKTKHDVLADKVKALVEGFNTSTYEWADGIWKRKS